jgi:cold shock CspA family protein
MAVDDFGFIKSPELSENLFFHGSALLIAPGSTVAVGDAVEFTQDHDRTGRPRAVNIRVIDRGPWTAGRSRLFKRPHDDPRSQSLSRTIESAGCISGSGGS